MKIQLATLDDTAKFASLLAKTIQIPQCIALNGTLGTGKTQFSRDLAIALGIEGQQVTSPTYVLHQLYHGTVTIHHFDFYRLDYVDQVWDLGIEELFEQAVLIIIEWAKKFPETLPEDLLTINFSQVEMAALAIDSSTSRQIEIEHRGPHSQDIYQKLRSDLIDQKLQFED